MSNQKTAWKCEHCGRYHDQLFPKNGCTHCNGEAIANHLGLTKFEVKPDSDNLLSELENLKKERDSLLLSLAQKDEALKRSTANCTCGLGQFIVVHADHCNITKHNKALSTPTPDTAILKQFEDLKHDSETLMIIERNLKGQAVTSLWIQDFIQRRKEALNPAKEGEK